MQSTISPLLILLLFFQTASTAAQGLEISGRVADATTGEMLPGATVQLIGERIFSGTTSKNGDFRFFPLPPGFYNLQISYIGYEPYTKEYMEITERKNLGKISLTPSKTEIKEVTVSGKTSLAVIKGDTVVYNADNYKTNPDANAQDLVAKMPGIIIEDGTVQAQGEDVKKVYVDGKSFFDQDPKLTLTTLPADIIQKIELFDEQSEQAQFTGFDDGETNKVMNIITRLKMRNGQFGKVYAGYGYDNKYMAGGNISFFNGDRRLSVIGQTNNVNQQNFSDEDLLGVLSSSGGGRRGGFSGGGGPPSGGGKGGGGGGARGPGGGGASAQDFMVGAQSGITTSHALGLNYTDKWGDKINVSGSYFFNMSDNHTVQNVFQDYLTSTENFSQHYTENDDSKSKNLNQRLHFKLDYNINDNNRLIVQPRLSIQKNTSESNNTGLSFINDSLLNTSINAYNSDRYGYNFSNHLTYMHKFEKQGRTISLNSSQGLNTNKSESKQTNESIEALTEERSDSLNQFNDNATAKKSLSLRAVYTEPIGKNAQLMLNAASSYAYNDNDKRIYNFDEPSNSYALPDTFLSNVYESSYNTQQLGGAFMQRWGERNNLMLSMNYENAALTSKQIFPENNDLKRSYHSLLPMLRLKIDMGNSQRFDMFYRTNTTSPSVTQLQNTIDNSNPLQLSSGNPLLSPSYEHNLRFRYSGNSLEKGSIFLIMANAKLTRNYVGNSTWYASQDTILGDDVLLQQGGQFSQPVNLDKQWSINMFSTYGMPISLIRSNVNVNLSYRYTHTPGIYNDAAVYSNNHVLSGGLTLSSNISEKVDFTLSSKTGYNSTSSTYLSTNNDYITQKTELKLNLIFPHNIVFRAAMASQYYYWTASQENEAFTMLNLELGKKIFKNQQGELKLSVYDVLSQNQSFSRSVTDIYVEDVQSNVLQRYAMLTFSYRLRNFKMDSGK